MGLSSCLQPNGAGKLLNQNRRSLSFTWAFPRGLRGRQALETVPSTWATLPGPWVWALGAHPPHTCGPARRDGPPHAPSSNEPMALGSVLVFIHCLDEGRGYIHYSLSHALHWALVEDDREPGWVLFYFYLSSVKSITDVPFGVFPH